MTRKRSSRPEISLLPGGSKAAARCEAARLGPTVASVKTAKEDTMATTLLDYHAMIAQLHVDELLGEAAATRKVQAARAARRQRGLTWPRCCSWRLS